MQRIKGLETDTRLWQDMCLCVPWVHFLSPCSTLPVCPSMVVVVVVGRGGVTLTLVLIAWRQHALYHKAQVEPFICH